MIHRLIRGLGETQRHLDSFSDRELAASLLSGIAVGGSLIGFLTYVLPHPQGTDFVVPSIAFCVSIAAGGLLWRHRRSVGWPAIGVMVALGSGVVTLVMLSVPGRSAAYVTYYVWLGIFAFYFLRPIWALAQVGLIGALYAVAVSMDSPPGAAEVWVNGVATTLGVGILVLALRSRIASLVGKLESEAATDELTELPNRRAFYDQLRRELRRRERERSDLALAILDLDGFKELNDTVGHLEGDRALHALADVLRSELRPMDWPARIGGDEFAILLPGAGTDDAVDVAGRLRLAIHERFAEGAVPLRASIGIAGAAGRELGDEALLAEADRALYAAKRLGGDRVLVAGTAAADPTLADG